MADESDLEKTEPPSSRRLEQAREEGQVPQSRELVAFLVMAAGALGLWMLSSWFVRRGEDVMRSGLTLDRQEALRIGISMPLREVSRPFAVWPPGRRKFAAQVATGTKLPRRASLFVWCPTTRCADRTRSPVRVARSSRVCPIRCPAFPTAADRALASDEAVMLVRPGDPESPGSPPPR